MNPNRFYLTTSIADRANLFAYARTAGRDAHASLSDEDLRSIDEKMCRDMAIDTFHVAIINDAIYVDDTEIAIDIFIRGFCEGFFDF